MRPEFDVIVVGAGPAGAAAALTLASGTLACAAQLSNEPLSQPLSQPLNPLPIQDAAATYPVQGVVLNTLTHQPIARVLVDASTDATLTDGDGVTLVSGSE